MGVRIRYMGNKRDMASDVAGLLDDVRPGRPVLDLFCGMCWVAGAVADSGRQVWVNDVQRYATLAAHCLVAGEAAPPRSERLLSEIAPAIERNRQPLLERFATQIAVEDAALAHPTVDGYQAAYQAYRHAAVDEEIAAEAAMLSGRRRATPYRLATLTFAWGYFGLRQSIELDSVRYAVDLHRRRRDLSNDEYSWAKLAIVQAASRIATGAGHTAQYLHATNAASLDRVVRLRRRDAIAQFAAELDQLAPYGDRDWREGNVVMSGDSLAIWPKLRRRSFRNAVVYADPPYSKNQYSRFYHVLETLTRYDYPAATGRGRYRPDRFITPFSTRTGVASAFDRLARGVARTGSALVLSYPSSGMLNKFGSAEVDVLLRRHFGSVSVVLRKDAAHSTLGAAHGSSTAPVQELLYLAV